MSKQETSNGYEVVPLSHRAITSLVEAGVLGESPSSCGGFYHLKDKKEDYSSSYGTLTSEIKKEI